MPLPPGQHRDWAEHLHVDEPWSSVEPAAREQHVSDDVAVVLSDQREPGVAGGSGAQRVHKVGHDLPAVTERRQVQPPNSRAVRWLLQAEMHHWNVELAVSVSIALSSVPVALRLAGRLRRPMCQVKTGRDRRISCVVSVGRSRLGR